MSTAILDCRPENFSSLSAADQSRFADAARVEAEIATISGHIFIVSDFEDIKGVGVATTNDEVEDTIRGFIADPESAKACFVGGLRNIVRYRDPTGKKIDDLYKNGGKEWDDFLADLKLYYCARAVLQKRPIPINHTKQEHRNRIIPQGISQWESMDDLPTCDSLPDGVGVVNQTRSPDVVPATIVEEDEDSNDEMTQAEAAEYNASCCVECGEVKEKDCVCEK